MSRIRSRICHWLDCRARKRKLRALRARLMRKHGHKFEGYRARYGAVS
jgi:hypothetical protein